MIIEVLFISQSDEKFIVSTTFYKLLYKNYEKFLIG